MLWSQIGRPAPEQSHLRSAVVATLAIAVGCLALVMLAATRPATALTVVDVRVAMPGLLVTLAMYVSHLGGQLDLSLGATFSLLVVVLGRSEAPGDLRVLAVVLLGVAAAVLSGLVVSWVGGGALGGILLYFLFRDLSLSVGGDVSRSSRLDQSFVLRGVSASAGPVPVDMILTAALIAGTAVLLARSDLGHRLRAYGLDRERVHLIKGTSLGAPLTVAAILALLLAVAAIISIARFGTSGTASDNAVLLQPLAAVVIGNGGVDRAFPAPVRVGVAYLVIHLLIIELRRASFSPVVSELVVAGAALAVMLVGRRRSVY